MNDAMMRLELFAFQLIGVVFIRAKNRVLADTLTQNAPKVFLAHIRHNSRLHVSALLNQCHDRRLAGKFGVGRRRDRQ